MHSSWENYLDDQDKLSLQLEDGTLQPLMNCLIPWTDSDYSPSCKEPMT